MTEKLKIEENYTHSDIWFNHVLVNNDGEYVGGVDSDYMSHAHLFAASPLMLEALDMAYAEIFRLITTSRMIQESHTHDSGEVLKTIAAAIAAAKGE